MGPFTVKMKNKILNHLSLPLALILLISMALPIINESKAESPGRIIERATNDWRGPTVIDYDDYITQLDKIILKNKNANTITKSDSLSSIKNLLNKSQISTATRIGLLIKLADIYTRQGRNERRRVLAQYRKKYRKWLNLENQDPNDKPLVSFDSSKSYFRNAIQTFRDLFNAYPKLNFDKRLLYKMAHLQLLVKNPNAQLYFQKILKNKTSSVWKYKAYLGMAEYYYQERKYKKAAKYYKSLFRMNKFGLSEYSQYKLAWISINRGRKNGWKNMDTELVNKGVNSLRQVINSTGVSPFSTIKNARYLRNNALNDLTLIWSEQRNIKKTTSYFLNFVNSPFNYFNTLERIGYTLLKEGKPKEAAKFYRIIFKKSPGRPNQIRLQLSLISKFQEKQLPLELLSEIQQLARTLTNKKGAWYQKNSRNPKKIKSIQKKTHALLLKYSSFYDKKYQESKSQQHLNVTNKLYAIFLLLFPKSNQAYDIRFNFAKTLELLKKYEEAVHNYHLVVRAQKSLSHHRELSAEKMIALQLLVVNKKKYPAMNINGIRKSPIPIPKPKKILIGVIDTYLKYFPDKSKSTSLRYKSATIMFQYGYYKPALVRFQDTVKRDPKAVESKNSVKIVLNFFHKRKDWPTLVSWAERFIKFEQHLGPKVSKLIVQHLTVGLWNIAANYEKTKQPKKAAMAYLNFQRRLPRDANADLALFKAMSLYYSIGDGNRGITIGKNLLATYPKSKYGSNTLFKIGKAFQSLNKYREAAITYESFVVKYPKDARAPDALVQSGLIYQGLSNLDRAALVFETLANKYPRSKHAAGAVLKSAEIHVKLEQFGKAAKSFNLFIRNFGRLNPEMTLYAQSQAIVLVSPNTPASINNKSLISLEQQLKAKPRTYAVKARNAVTKFYFEITNGIISEFSHQKVAYYDFNEYESSISSYLDQIKMIELYFSKLLAIASPEGITEAQYKLGLVYELALRSFQEKWNMEGLRQEEAINILNAKERVTIGLREKVELAYTKAIENAKQSKIFTKYRNSALEKISKIRPDKYRPLKEEYKAPN